MSTLSLAPEWRVTEDEEPYGFIAPEFEIRAEGDEPNADDERVRYDEQILAGLVSF